LHLALTLEERRRGEVLVRVWERRERRGAKLERKKVEGDGPCASAKLDANPLWIQRAALPALMGGTVPPCSICRVTAKSFSHSSL